MELPVIVDAECAARQDVVVGVTSPGWTAAGQSQIWFPRPV